MHFSVHPPISACTQGTLVELLLLVAHLLRDVDDTDLQFHCVCEVRSLLRTCDVACDDAVKRGSLHVGGPRVPKVLNFTVTYLGRESYCLSHPSLSPVLRTRSPSLRYSHETCSACIYATIFDP